MSLLEHIHLIISISSDVFMTLFFFSLIYFMIKLKNFIKSRNDKHLSSNTNYHNKFLLISYVLDFISILTKSEPKDGDIFMASFYIILFVVMLIVNKIFDKRNLKNQINEVQLFLLKTEESKTS